MAILKKLKNQGSILSNLNGVDGPTPNLKGSKLHDEYSINGTPNIPLKPSPSKYDMNGKIPKNNYRDNAPEGRTF